MKATLALLLCVNVSCVLAEDAFKPLYEAHQWLELRTAVQKGNAPPFYRGAVASAFNDATEAASEPELATAARRKLALLYWRLARYQDALGVVDQLLKAHPQDADARNMRPLFEVLSHYPNQSVDQRRATRIRYELKGGNLVIPVSINGKLVHYILDTGYTTCSLSQSEGKRVGLTTSKVSIDGGGSLLKDSVRMQAGMAERLAIGDFQWGNVACTMLPDSAEPFADLPPGEQGIIGLPVILTFGTLRWSADGTMEIGFAAAPSGTNAPNLWLDELTLMTRAGFGRESLDLHVDAGSTDTQLLPRFNKQFAKLVAEQGKKSSQTVTQISGSKEVESVVLPEVRFRIGGFEAVLKDAPILLESRGLSFAHGVVGMDILGKARRVSLDFTGMTIGVE